MINLLLPFLVTAVFFLSLVFSFLLNKCRPYLFVVLLYLIVDVKNSCPAQTEYTPYEICGCQQLYPMTILYVLASIRFILLYEVMCNFETDARTILIPQSFMVDCGLHIISVFFTWSVTQQEANKQNSPLWFVAMPLLKSLHCRLRAAGGVSIGQRPFLDLMVVLLHSYVFIIATTTTVLWALDSRDLVTPQQAPLPTVILQNIQVT